MGLSVVHVCLSHCQHQGENWCVGRQFIAYQYKYLKPRLNVKIHFIFNLVLITAALRIWSENSGHFAWISKKAAVY